MFQKLVTQKYLVKLINEKKFTTVFQPIFSLKNGNILGYEALSRVDQEENFKISEIFTAAKKYSLSDKLEYVTRQITLNNVKKQRELFNDSILFLNISPQIIISRSFQNEFPELLSKNFLNPKDITLELTERTSIKDLVTFQKAVLNLKHKNHQIALDDIGSAYSGLSLISQIEPNFIKIDMEIVRDLNLEIYKYAIIKGLVEISKITKIMLIAEGIENKDELETLTCLGVQYGQGYYLQRPIQDISQINKNRKDAF